MPLHLIRESNCSGNSDVTTIIRSVQCANSPGKETTSTFHATTWSTQYTETNLTPDQLRLLKSSNSRQMILLSQKMIHSKNTDANIDATYNRTPSEPKPWFPVDKPIPTLYN
jgi:hypothetical protein